MAPTNQSTACTLSSRRCIKWHMGQCGVRSGVLSGMPLCSICGTLSAVLSCETCNSYQGGAKGVVSTCHGVRHLVQCSMDLLQTQSTSLQCNCAELVAAFCCMLHCITKIINRCTTHLGLCSVLMAHMLHAPMQAATTAQAAKVHMSGFDTLVNVTGNATGGPHPLRQSVSVLVSVAVSMFMQLRVRRCLSF
jgi:hypothetical protein